MKLRGAFSLAVALALVIGHWSFAEPYIAVREGYKCSQCHVNITGGGLRTDFGRIYSQTVLPAKTVRLPEGSFFDGTLGEKVFVGGNLRLDNLTRRARRKTDNTFGFSEANLFIHGKVVGDWLSLYADETFAPGGASNRETFALIKWRDVHLKAGKFLLPYGLRLLDDTAFIRQTTGFNYTVPDTGVEVGFEPGPMSIFLALTNGTGGALDVNTNKQLTAQVAYIARRGRVGLSFSDNRGANAKRRAVGLFGGLNLGRFTFLAEIDRLSDRGIGAGAPGRVIQNISLVEMDVLITKGWNLKLVYEFLEPNTKIDEDELTRFSVGVEPFLTQFLQLSLFYRQTSAPPQSPMRRERALVFQVHLFF